MSSGLDRRDETVTKKEEDEKKNWNDPANWVNFIKSLLFYFVATLVLGLVGSNFVWLTRQGSTLEHILPDLEDDPFYNSKYIDVDMEKANNSENCDDNESNTLTEKIKADNFPYNLKRARETHSDLSVGERLGSWFGWITEGTFIFNRGLIKSWIQMFSPIGGSPLGNEVFLIFIIAPLTGFLSIIAGFTGFGVACSSAFKTDVVVSVWGLFLWFFWAVTILMGAVMFIRLIALLLLYPIHNGWKTVSSIFRCNALPLAILFGFFTVGSAYDTLDSTVSGAMGIVYLTLVIIAIVKKIKEKSDNA